MLCDLDHNVIISIHALREEGDKIHSVDLPTRADFYPRPPRGGRQYAEALGKLSELFLSTPSARRATAKTEKKSLLLV